MTLPKEKKNLKHDNQVVRIKDNVKDMFFFILILCFYVDSGKLAFY